MNFGGDLTNLLQAVAYAKQQTDYIFLFGISLTGWLQGYVLLWLGVQLLVVAVNRISRQRVMNSELDMRLGSHGDELDDMLHALGDGDLDGRLYGSDEI